MSIMDKNKKFIEKIHESRYSRLPTHYPSITLWKKYRINQNSHILRALSSISNTTGMYINIPFCEKKCKFCFLDILTNKEELKKYHEYLVQEFKLYSDNGVKDIPIDTIYIGGGTPNILPEHALEKIFNGIFLNFNLSKLRQLSMESNIDFWTDNKIKLIKNYRVNFVSIGIQTFDVKILKQQNRIQDIKKINKIFELLKKYEIKIGVDLLIGIATQQRVMINDIKKLIKLKPEQIHINRYKPVDRKILPEEKQKMIILQNYAFKILEENGYQRIDEDSCILAPYSEVKRNIQGNPQYHIFNNIIPLGIGAMGHIYGRIRYRNFLNYQMYKDMIKDKKFPIEKYILITEKEEITHYALVKIGMEGEIYLPEMLSKFSKDSCFYILKKLKNLEKKNVLTFSNNRVIANSEIDWYNITLGLYDKKYIY